MLHSFGREPMAPARSRGLIEVKGTFLRHDEQQAARMAMARSLASRRVARKKCSTASAAPMAESNSELDRRERHTLRYDSEGGAHGDGTSLASRRPAKSKCCTALAAAVPMAVRLYARLTDVNGTLYGTTEFGGAYGYGTVFALTP